MAWEQFLPRGAWPPPVPRPLNIGLGFLNIVKTILMFFSFRYQDQDAQSDTGSERSVTPAAFVATTQPHPAHHQTPQGIPYHMHHSLIQHLTDMRDLYGSHQSITGISNHHNSN